MATPIHQGTDFWLAYPSNMFAADGAVFILADAATNFTVEIPGLGISVSDTAAPGSPGGVNIPSTASIQTSEVVENKGIHVTSDLPVTAVCLYPRVPVSTNGACLGLPVSALSSGQYVVPAYLGFSSAPSQVTLAAAVDGTNVTVVPSCLSQGGTPAGSMINLVLNRGQTWQYRCTNLGDTTGTRVTADQPLSVFGGVVCAMVPPSVSFCDYLAEQVLPLDFWGLDYYAAPIQNGTTNLVRALASQDGTTVTFDDGLNPKTVVVLNAGQFSDFPLTDLPVHVTADRPILVVQYGTGVQNPPENTNRDPFMMQNVATEFFLESHRLISPPNYSLQFVSIVAPVGAAVLLDGAPVLAFSPLPGGTHQWAAVPVDAGEHTVTADQPVMAYAYGFGQFVAYGYPAGIGAAAVPTTTTPPPKGLGWPSGTWVGGVGPYALRTRWISGSASGFSSAVTSPSSRPR